MAKKHSEELLNTMIKHAGFDILEATGNELPTKDEAIAFLGNTDDLDACMKKVFKKEKAKWRRRKARRSVSRVAVMLAVLVIVSGVAVMSSEALRARFFNLFQSTNEIYTSYDYTEEYDVSEKHSDIILPSYLPEGYELIRIDELNNRYVCFFQNAHSEVFMIEQSSGKTSKTVDNEQLGKREILIGNNPAFVFENKDENLLLVYLDTFTLSIFGRVSVDELVKIAESMM